MQEPALDARGVVRVASRTVGSSAPHVSSCGQSTTRRVERKSAKSIAREACLPPLVGYRKWIGQGLRIEAGGAFQWQNAATPRTSGELPRSAAPYQELYVLPGAGEWSFSTRGSKCGYG